MGTLSGKPVTPLLQFLLFRELCWTGPKIAFVRRSSPLSLPLKSIHITICHEAFSNVGCGHHLPLRISNSRRRGDRPNLMKKATDHPIIFSIWADVEKNPRLTSFVLDNFQLNWRTHFFVAGVKQTNDLYLCVAHTYVSTRLEHRRIVFQGRPDDLS